MEYKFVWGDGTFDYSPVNSGINHAGLLARTFGSNIPKDFTAGKFDDDLNIELSPYGEPGLTEDELRFLIRQELERYDKRSYSFPQIAAKIANSGEEAWPFVYFVNEDEYHFGEYGGFHEDIPEYAELVDNWDEFADDIDIELKYGRLYRDGEVKVYPGGNDPLTKKIIEEAADYLESLEKSAANVEDTEPEYNFGFLTEPHDTLYPCAFEGEKMRPDALKKIKSYVMDAVGEGSDDYIYMTVYGSGASYNWDETGDFDVQMWVDIDAYNEHNKEVPLTSDELLDMVRRGVQTVNFPSFKELGLDTEDCAGDMLIQYYAKPGKGTPEENLASKPYSCYDMETDEWLQQPEPITPEFYGDMFLLVQAKAHDIAEQAEALFAQFQRNILNWQFWTQIAEKYDHADYRAAAEDSRTNATLEQQGIATLFEGVFGGRKEAYSPEGEGMRDERDIVQKMLEVWGIFQKLKHYARAPLPWDEQEMPESKEARSWREVTNVLKEHNYPSYGGTFGYIADTLIIGTSHHQSIIAGLLNNGWTWEQLFAAEQAWGWWDVIRLSNHEATIAMSFTSDSGRQDNTAVEKAINAMEELTGTEVKVSEYDPSGVDDENAYGAGLSGRGFIDGEYTGERGKKRLEEYIRTELPTPPKTAATFDEATQRMKALGLPTNGTLGYVNGNLIWAKTHHQAIIMALINNGWTWEDLFTVPQCWGWWGLTDWNEESGQYDPEGVGIAVSFSSDSGKQDQEAIAACKAEMAKQTGLKVRGASYGTGVHEIDSYGTGLRGRGFGEKYLEGGEHHERLKDIINSPIPPPPGEMKTASTWKEKGLPKSGCFGYIADHLILGSKHHQQIMAKLMSNGWDWMDMFTQPQAWGWYYIEDYGTPRIDIRFTSDAGVQTEEEKEKAEQAFRELYGIENINRESYEKGIDAENAEGYGSGLRGKQNMDNYLTEGSSWNNLLEQVIGVIPPPPSKDYVPENPPDPELWAWFNEVFGPMQESAYPEPPKSDVQEWFEKQEWGKEPEPIKGEKPEWFNEMFPQHGLGRLPEDCTGQTIIYNPAVYGKDNKWIVHSNPVSDAVDFANVKGTHEFGAGSPGCPVHGSENWAYSIDGLNPELATPKSESEWTKMGSLQKFADWNDIMAKATRLREGGHVKVLRNAPDTVAGTVDAGTEDKEPDPSKPAQYDTQIWRDDPNSQSITMWDCGCQWSDYSWGRTRQFKKYEGRPCSHALALFWEAQGMPVEDAESASNAPQPVPGGGMQENMDVTPMMQPFDPSDLIAPFGTPQTDGTPESVPLVGDEALMEPIPVTQPQPAYSQPTVPKDTSPFGIPGALSKVAAFQNGQIVRAKVDLYGEEPTAGTPHIVPMNTTGEVLYSDEKDTVVIFPLSGGQLTPHLIRVECDTSELSPYPAGQPFIKKKHHSATSEWKEVSESQE